MAGADAGFRRAAGACGEEGRQVRVPGRQGVPWVWEQAVCSFLLDLSRTWDMTGSPRCL